MSEFKFVCFQCGQKLRVDEVMIGMSIHCPACRKSIVVPAPPDRPEAARPAAPARPVASVRPTTPSSAEQPVSVPVRSPAPAGTPGFPASSSTSTPAPTPPPARTYGDEAASISNLATASLGLSFLGPIGCIPAIICGHLAKAQIRNNPKIAGGQRAGIGLGIGYTFLALSLGLAPFVPGWMRDDAPNVVAIDQAAAPDNPFAARERLRMQEQGIQFQGNTAPATAVFTQFTGPREERSIKFLVTSHAEKSIRQLDFVFLYMDSEGNRISEQVFSHAPGKPSIVDPATTVEMDLKPLNIPTRATTVQASIRKAVFADGSQWPQP